MSLRKTELLIVGQGLAGSILAHQLAIREIDFMVMDEPSLSLSSRVAAGIWNPIVFKRMTESWMAAEVVPVMHGFFKQAEATLSAKFVSKRKILKFFTEQQEAGLWKKKYTLLENFIDPQIYPPQDLNIPGISVPSTGFSFVTESGNIDTAHFINSTRKWLEEKHNFIEERFDHTQLEFPEDGFRYKEISARKIIFCEGFLKSANSLFDFIPFKPAKGEVMTIECEDLKTEHILQKGIFILPLGNSRFKCGATYEWNDLSQEVTSKGQSELEEKLQHILKLPYTVIERQAGIRPSVIDRRPVLGEHPEKKGLYIFNGFGTKAVMLAPYFADELINFILENKELNKEVKCERFLKK
jgi:glycine oxidase